MPVRIRRTVNCFVVQAEHFDIAVLVGSATITVTRLGVEPSPSQRQAGP